MKLLVTGGCGYVGSQLVKELLLHDHSVTVLDTMWFGNYLKKNDKLRVIKSDIRYTNDMDNEELFDVDAIFHLANIANDPSSEIDPRLTWEVNVLGSKLLVETAILNGVKRFIYASSGSVYGVKEEENVTEDLDLDPISDYNKTKMVSERVLMSYKDEIEVYLLRPATVCGYSPRMRLDLTVNLLTQQAIEDGVITVFGGDQVRPNVHISDMVSAYLHFLSGDFETGVYNVGFENMSVYQIASIVSERVGVNIRVTENNDPRSYRLNSDKLLSTGFTPHHSVNDAVEEIIVAYKKNIIQTSDNNYNVKKMVQLRLNNG